MQQVDGAASAPAELIHRILVGAGIDPAGDAYCVTLLDEAEKHLGKYFTMEDPSRRRPTERELAVGLGVPPYLMHGDLSEVNFSSIRAGLIAFRERVEMLQHSMLVFQFLRPVFEKWITIEVLAQRIKSTIDESLPATWVTPRQVWVDPLKDVQAEILQEQHGFKSRREIVASRGVDIEVLDQERADELAREKELGLPPRPADQNKPSIEDGDNPAAQAA